MASHFMKKQLLFPWGVPNLGSSPSFISGVVELTKKLEQWNFEDRRKNKTREKETGKTDNRDDS
jgi:hypothetical protein